LQFKTSSLHMRTNIRRNKQSHQLTDDLIHFCRYMRILEVVYQTARKLKYIYFLTINNHGDYYYTYVGTEYSIIFCAVKMVLFWMFA